jgi:hypothetical protein
LGSTVREYYLSQNLAKNFFKNKATNKVHYKYWGIALGIEMWRELIFVNCSCV